MSNPKSITYDILYLYITMSAFWRFNLPKVSKQLIKPKVVNPAKSPEALSSGNIDESFEVKPIKTGLAWSANALRLKSDQDLTRLWYVLLKEKLALTSDEYAYAQQKVENKELERVKGLVLKSMYRVKDIKKERISLINDFYRFLEFHYLHGEMYKEMFRKKFPKLAHVEKPMYGRMEMKQLDEKERQLDLFMKVNCFAGIETTERPHEKGFGLAKLDKKSKKSVLTDNSEALYGRNLDLVLFREDYKGDLDYNDYFGLLQVDDSAEYDQAFDSASKEKRKLIKAIKYNRLDPVISALKQSLFKAAENVLDIRKRNMNSKHERFESFLKTTKETHPHLTTEELQAALKVNHDYANKEINLEYFYIEMLKEETNLQDYIDMDISSMFLNEEILKFLMFRAHSNSAKQMLLEGTTEKVGVLDPKEIQAVQDLKKTGNATEIAKEYVKNLEQLRGKQKRRVINAVQLGRSRVARDIFLKELAAVSYKVKGMKEKGFAKKAISDNI